MNFRLLLIVVFAVSLAACEKDVTFDLDETTPKLVVDGSIETGQPPVIVLSNSLDYFSTITPELLSSSFVHDAAITISNGSRTHQLKEYTIQLPNNVKLFYYSNNINDPSTAFVGETNKTYTLNINVNGTNYQAATTIPSLNKTNDSIWWKPAPNVKDTSYVILMGKFTDPPGLGNYIRYYTKTNSDPFYPGLNSVFDDQIVDGTTYSIEIERGVNRNEEFDRENYSFFKRGDTATLKFTNIDKGTFDFWRTMEYSYGSIGNPFASPTKVTGNIKNGLGHFGGYATQFRTIIIPK